MEHYSLKSFLMSIDTLSLEKSSALSQNKLFE